MTVGEALPRNAQQHPKKLALRDDRTSRTHLDLHLRTNRLANYLLGHGVKPGDVVPFSCGSRCENFEILFALAKIGAVAVPFDYHWSANECDAMTRFLEPRAFVVETREETKHLLGSLPERFPPSRLLAIDRAESRWTPYEEAVGAGAIEDPPVKVESKDVFLMMITSGTTGFPKACIVDHETYVIRSLNNAIIKAVGPDTRALLGLPLHFNAGRGSMVAILYLGGTVFLQERFREDLFLSILEEEKISYTMLVPTLCNRLLRHRDLDRIDKSSLQFLGITGGHLSAEETLALTERVCPRVYEAYASTDCGQMTVVGPEDRERHGETVGRPIWCVLLRIADENGREVSPHETGEICVRSPLCIQGYYRNPEATAEFFAGGWCHTGDIGFVDAEGYLHISGRKKSMIKSGGISIFPDEIEGVLSRHPKVAEAAVVGFKDDEWGEAVKAFVVLKAGQQCDSGELLRFCKESLAAYKAPKSLEFVESLPRTGLGKIDRGKLNALVDAG